MKKPNFYTPEDRELWNQLKTTWKKYGVWIIWTVALCIGFLNGIIVGLNHINH